MPWVKVDEAFYDHPKFLDLDAGAVGIWLIGLAYSNRYLTGGAIPRRGLARAYPGGDREKHARSLVTAGLWDPTEDGWVIHDYLTYQPSKAQVEAQRKERSESGKRGAARRWGKAPPEPEPPPNDSNSHGSSHSNSNGSLDDNSHSYEHGKPDGPSRPVPRSALGFAGLDSSLNSTSATNSDSGHQPSPNGEIYDQVRADFDTFWNTFPKRHGRLRDQVGTFRRWLRLTAADRTNALVAVVNYAAERGDDKPTAAKDPDRWLKDRDWADYLEPVTTVTRLDQRKPPARRSAAETLAARRGPPPGGAS